MNGQITVTNLRFPLTNTNTEFAPQSSKKTNLSLFKDFLNNRDEKGDEGVENTVNNTVKQKTFREFEKGIKVKVKKTMIQGEKEAASDNGTSVETKKDDVNMSVNDNTSIMLNCLAQVMEVKNDEIVKLLESAGIKPEELTPVSESDTLEIKLSQAFEPDGKMEKILEKISGKKAEWVKLDEIKLTDIPDISELSDIMLEFRPKLKEMEEIPAAILKVPEGTEETGTVSAFNSGDDESSEVDANTVKESGINQTVNETEQIAAPDVLTAQYISVKPETQEISQTFVNAISQIQSKEPEFNTENIKMKTPLPDREILYQVIEKAKVVISTDKSEMIMDLKPESLGKLTLKVVTEHGMIMARFIAENQQVKQVLETNMQLLKDSLEKQGLNVQGFSVSVRQESQNSRGDYNNQGDNRRTVPTVHTPSNGRIYVDAVDIERLQRINPYRQEGNTINLTA